MSYDISQTLAFANNSIIVYKYESFRYTISNPYAPTVPVTTVSTGIPASLVVTDANRVVFSSFGYAGGTSSNESIVIDISSGFATSSNAVTIAAGRFRDASGNSMSNNVFQFYKNEAITPVVFNASISLVSPLQAYPALPVGLTFSKTASNQFTLSGTPTVEVPTSNYQIIGQGSNSDIGKVVTTVVNLTVNAERLQLDLSGSPIVSPMSIGVPITQRSVYAKYPQSSPGNLRYTWNPLPNGLFFGDYLGLSQASGFQPIDASYTLTLQGTPTLAAAKSFVAAGITSYTAGVQALRLSAPNISNTTAFTFQFEPTVLFDDVTIPTFYTGIALDPSATSFRARTYFGTDTSITAIFSPDLRTDLSLNFVSNEARAYLTGTPTSADSSTYTIRASNALGVTRDLAALIVVSNDSVAFDYSVTPLIDTCYNFILSRPLSLAKTGYYPASVQFKATAASGRNVTFSAPGFAGTGVSLSNVSANVVQLTGVPDTVTSLTTFTVTASAVGSPATASTTIKASILNDVFTFGDVSATLFNWIQNKAIAPIQISATTLSERPVIGYSIAGVPTGIVITPGGQISGSPLQDLNGSAVVTATTGFASQNNSYTYSTRTDDILIALANGVETVTGSFSNIEFRGISYSGNVPELRLVPNLQPYQSPTPLDLSLSPTGFLSGNLNATTQLQPRYSFDISANVEQFAPVNPTKMVVDVANAQTARHIMMVYSIGQAGDESKVEIYGHDGYGYGINTAGALVTNLFQSDWPLLKLALISSTYASYFDIAQNSNCIIAAIDSNMFRSVDNGVTWTQCTVIGDLFGHFPCIANDGGSNWVAIGAPASGGVPSSWTSNVLRVSTDDGVTWSDSSISPIATAVQKLVYNNGRYFLLQSYGKTVDGYSSDRPAIQYASASDLSNWTGITNAFTPSPPRFSTARSFATDGTTLVIVGGDFTAGDINVYTSTNNGTTWTGLNTPASEVTYTGTRATDIQYADGKWVVVGNLTSNGSVYYTTMWSTDLVTWNFLVSSPLLTDPTAVTFDGNSWFTYGGGPTPGVFLQPQRIEPGSPTSATPEQPSTLPGIQSPRRALFRLIDNGSRSATLSIPYTSGGYSFVNPVVPYAPLYQYISTTIPVQIQTAPEFIYYYASQLPRGLTFTPDTNGVSAIISGIPYQFSDRPSSTILFARLPQAGVVVALQLPLRVILPSFLKRTDAASGFTSLLRQYTVVNAAQNARDNRVFPQVDRLLGEFTAPYPPNVITQTIDPKCQNPNC